MTDEHTHDAPHAHDHEHDGESHVHEAGLEEVHEHSH